MNLKKELSICARRYSGEVVQQFITRFQTLLTYSRTPSISFCEKNRLETSISSSSVEQITTLQTREVHKTNSAAKVTCMSNSQLPQTEHHAKYKKKYFVLKKNHVTCNKSIRGAFFKFIFMRYSSHLAKKSLFFLLFCIHP